MINRTTTLPRVAHTKASLKSVAENWPHTHGVNEEGNQICVPCMAELLYDIHELVFRSAAMSSDGKVVIK